MSNTNWKGMPHEVPEPMKKYLPMLCEACSADNELKLLTRFQKVLRLIYDEKVTPAPPASEKEEK